MNHTSNFPIDLVYTYIDGSDPDFIARKNEALSRLGRPTAVSALKGRFDDHDELRYSLRSVERFAPFARTIYIVTGSRVPQWLDTSRPDVKVINDVSLLGSPYTETFNSNAIESSIHKIEGLAEHFIALNDDFFFGRTTSPEDFFPEQGKVLYYTTLLTSKFITKMKMKKGSTNTYGATRNNTLRAVEEHLGNFIPLHLPHIPRPFLRTVAEAAAQEFSDEYHTTRATVFRSCAEYQPTYFFPIYAALKGYGTIRRASPFLRIEVHLNHKGLARKLALIKILRPKFFCLNDGAGTPPESFGKVRSFLEKAFPVPSKYEKS
jgi:hypothetical protein